MKITDVPFALLRFQYGLARLPLQLIGERVLTRMDPEAPARLAFERSLGLLDLTAGTALRAPEWERRGAALVERSDELRRAARLDAAATDNIDEPPETMTRRDTAPTGQDVGAQPPGDVIDRLLEDADGGVDGSRLDAPSAPTTPS